MKKIVPLFFLLLCITLTSTYAQPGVLNLPLNSQPKNTEKSYGCILKAPPKLDKNIGDIAIGNNPSKITNVTLPIVFHTIYSDLTYSITLRTADELIAGLNKEFAMQSNRFLQAKANGKLPQYILDAATDNTQISFCLAHTDQQGKATSGIVEKYSGNKPVLFSPYSPKLFDDNQGGSTPWDKAKYINIYVVQDLLHVGVAGYSPAGQYIVLDANGLDNNNFLSDLVHEMGHFLGLEHTWGGLTDKDLNKDCNVNKDDGVDDTPMQEGPSSDHPDYKSINANYFNQIISCNNAALGGNQYLNYMDYSKYAMMFTKKQKIKMHDYIAANLSGMVNSLKCNTGTCVNDQFDQQATNNDFASATLLNPNVYIFDNGIGAKGVYKGLLCKSDVDYYKFNVVKGAGLFIRLQHSMYHNIKNGTAYQSYIYKLKAELFKKSGNQYIPIPTYPGSTLDKNYAFEFEVLTPHNGDEEYYLKVQGLTVDDYQPFVPYLMDINNNVKIDFDPQINCFKYDGDGSISMATYVSQPKIFFGDICSSKDKDFYKVFLDEKENAEDKSNTLAVTLKDLDGGDLDMVVYDYQGKILSDPPKNGLVSETFNKNLPKGWYYIEVKPKPGISAGYTLDVNFGISYSQGVEASLYCKKGLEDYEPNDLIEDAFMLSAADNLNPNELIFGVFDYICPANDDDYYTFTLDQMSDLSLQLYGGGDGFFDLPGNYNVGLFDGGGNFIKESANPGNEKEALSVLNLKPGKYYLRVYGATIYEHDNEEPYKLIVLATKTGGTQPYPGSDLPIVNAYPNPARESVTLSISNNLTARAAQVTFTNVYGKVELVKNVEFVRGNTVTPISVSNIPKGIYTVTIKDGREVYHTRLSIER